MKKGITQYFYFTSGLANTQVNRQHHFFYGPFQLVFSLVQISPSSITTKEYMLLTMS